MMIKFILVLSLFLTIQDGGVEALRFAPSPITVDTEVILINRPATLTCNYVKFKTESVREITWYAAYEGFRSKIFHYHVTTGKKEDSTYSHIKTIANTATEKDLTVVLPEFRGSPITIGCEIEVLRDNGYGKLAHSKKLGEVNITVVETQGHQMIVKKGKWDDNGNMGNLNPHEATVGQPLTVSCLSRGSNPSPNLTMTLNGRAWQESSATSKIVTPMGVPADTMILEGRMDTVYDSLFNSDGILAIECTAKYQDYLFEKKQLGLTKKSTTYVSDSRYNSNIGQYNSNQPRRGYNEAPRPQTSNYGTASTQPQNYGPSNTEYGQRKGRVVHHSDEGHDADVIHSRLLDLMDPSRHMHIGIPYDFYTGYILMVAKNVDDDENAVEPTSYYSSSRTTSPKTPTTNLYGRFPTEVINDLQRNYGRFQKISDEKFRIKMSPVDVLNLLGKHGYRVIGFTAEADQKMVWTLEQKDFENKLLKAAGRGSDHNHNL